MPSWQVQSGMQFATTYLPSYVSQGHSTRWNYCIFCVRSVEYDELFLRTTAYSSFGVKLIYYHTCGNPNDMQNVQK